MRYRRSKLKGETFFFTVVTFERKPILCTDNNIDLLRSSFRRVKQNHPFEIESIVIMPNHLHCIWKLPEGDNEYSMRWNLIKNIFTKKTTSASEQERSDSRMKRREHAVWQRRFWEHTIRDEEDFTRHVNYIHYNPVKHGYAKAPKEWPYSSFHQFVAAGILNPDWGGGRFITEDLPPGAE